MIVASTTPGLTFKTLEGYRTSLRENARGLWNGTFNWYDFYSNMVDTITRGFNQAWAEGMAKYGMSMDDRDAEERTRLQREIQSEVSHIEGVADFIEAYSKANGGTLAVCMQRIEGWVAAYTRIVQLATAMAAANRKLKWNMHPAEHCGSCLKLAGKVKRGKYWTEHVTPKDWDKLECRKGCKCSLDPTDEPCSKGPLPSLP